MGKDRKPRKDLLKKQGTPDLLKPIDLTQIGLENDPCFGKLYDPREDVCKRCGDNEFCILKMSQLANTKRTKIEKTQKFKDLEEAKIYDDLNKKEPKEIRKEVRSYIIKLVKENKNGIDEFNLIEQIYGVFMKYSIVNQKRIKKWLLGLLEKNNSLNKTKNIYTWKTSK